MDKVSKNVPRGTFLQFEEYFDFLKSWNEKINLSSRTGDITEVFEESALEAVKISQEVEGKKIVDIGSGGGFPGLFLAILGHDITMVEVNIKKCVFLQHVVHKLELKNAKVVNADIKKHSGDYDMITSKAVTSVAELLDMSKHLISERVQVYLPKSQEQLGELEGAEEDWSFELRKLQIDDTNIDVILILSNLSPR